MLLCGVFADLVTKTIYMYSLIAMNSQSLVNCLSYFKVVTWTKVICLICLPKARGLRVYISGKSRVPTLQLSCNCSIRLIVLMPSVIIGFFLYACLKDSIMVRCGQEERAL